MLYALIGLLIAVPLTFVVVILLIRSDELFADWINDFVICLPNFSFSVIWEIVCDTYRDVYFRRGVFNARRCSRA